MASTVGIEAVVGRQKKKLAAEKRATIDFENLMERLMENVNLDFPRDIIVSEPDTESTGEEESGDGSE